MFVCQIYIRYCCVLCCLIANELARYENLIQIIFIKFQLAPSPADAGQVAQQLRNFEEYIIYHPFEEEAFTYQRMQDDKEMVNDWCANEEEKRRIDSLRMNVSFAEKSPVIQGNGDQSPASESRSKSPSKSATKDNTPVNNNCNDKKREESSESHHSNDSNSGISKRTVSHVIVPNNQNNNANCDNNDNNSSNNDNNNDQNECNNQDEDQNEQSQASNSHESFGMVGASLFGVSSQSAIVQHCTNDDEPGLSLIMDENSNANVNKSNDTDKITEINADLELEEGEIIDLNGNTNVSNNNNNINTKETGRKLRTINRTRANGKTKTKRKNKEDQSRGSIKKKSNEKEKQDSVAVSTSSDDMKNDADSDFQLQFKMKPNADGTVVYNYSNENVEIRHVRSHVLQDINNPKEPTMSYDWTYNSQQHNYDFCIQYLANSIIGPDGNFGQIPFDTNVEVYARDGETSERKKWTVHCNKSEKVHPSGEALWSARKGGLNTSKPEPMIKCLNKHFSNLRAPRMLYSTLMSICIFYF